MSLKSVTYMPFMLIYTEKIYKIRNTIKDLIRTGYSVKDFINKYLITKSILQNCN